MDTQDILPELSKEDQVVKLLEDEWKIPTTDKVNKACKEVGLTFDDVAGYWRVFDKVLNRWKQLNRRY